MKSKSFRDNGEFIALSWYGPFKEHPKKCAESLLEIGVTGTALMEEGDTPRGEHLAALGLKAAPILDNHTGLFFVRDYLKEAAEKFLVNRNDQSNFIRKPCVNNPADKKKAFDLILKRGAAYKADSLYWLSLCNEPSVARCTAAFDFCFCDYCKEAYKKWQIDKYGKIYFAPVTTDQARKRFLQSSDSDLSDWFSFRQFTSESFSSAMNEAAALMKGNFPEVKIALTGLWPPGLFGGNDWESFGKNFDVLESYDECGEIELVRSFYGETTDFVCSFPASCTEEDDKKFWEYSMWHFFIHGCRAVIIDKLKHLTETKGDGSVTPAGRELAGWVMPMKNIYAPLLAGYKRLDDEILILHSFESMSRAWIENVLPDGEEWAARPSVSIHEKDAYLNREVSWYRLVEDSGRQFKVVSEKIGLDDLSGKGRVLILPFAVALSDNTINWIRGFLSSGGTVIHDSPIALYDENLTKRVKIDFEGNIHYLSNGVMEYSRERLRTNEVLPLLKDVRRILDSVLPAPDVTVISDKNERIEITQFVKGAERIAVIHRNDIRRMFVVDGVKTDYSTRQINLKFSDKYSVSEIGEKKEGLDAVKPLFYRLVKKDQLLVS
ncbi:MAG: hypothetical protein JNL74_05095 [Fibrobacteres bacterium]|nr:hypothetical protein [Fibrobacterota bacterium]